MKSRWLEPDERWSFFGHNGWEQFEDTYVIRARFHSAVPEDVQKAYETVEYLMAHSYYHWPMYDVAFHKMLLIFEMAVKLKANQKGFSTHNKKLYELIDQIKPFNIHPDRLDWAMGHFKRLRNSSSHPDRNSYSGGFVLQQVYFLHNTINELFLHESYRPLNSQEFQTVLASFSGPGVIIENSEKKLLVASLTVLESIQKSDNDHWHFLQLEILMDPQLIADGRVQVGEVFLIRDWQLNPDGTELQLEAEGEEFIKIYRSNKTENIEKYPLHNEAIQALSSIGKEIYSSYLKSEGARSMERFRYKYFWL